MSDDGFPQTIKEQQMSRHYFENGPRNGDYQDTVQDEPENAILNQENEKLGNYRRTNRTIEAEGVESIVWTWEPAD
jgi:hypothetical protein